MESGVKISALCAASALFAAPMSEFQEIRKRKRVGERSLFPFVCMWANTWMWIAYGLYVGDIVPTVVTNLLGFAFATYYCAVFAWAVGESPSQRKEAYRLISTTICIVCALCLVCYQRLVTRLMLGVKYDDSVDDGVKKWAGVAAAVSTVTLYASPLAALVKVVRRKSTEGLSRRLAIVSLVCGMLWLCYGSLTNEPFIYVPNVLGVMAALAQCSLLLMYPRKGIDSGKRSPSKLQRKDSSASRYWASATSIARRTPMSPVPSGVRSPKPRDGKGRAHRDSAV